MKTKFKTSVLLAFVMLVFVNVSYSVTPVNNTPEIEVYNSEFLKYQLDVDDFLAKDFKEIESKLGKKLRFQDKLAFKIIKRKLKRAYKKGATNEDLVDKLAKNRTEFSLLAFLWGLFFGIVGVLIVFIFMKRGKMRSAWRGFFFWILLVILGVVSL